MRKLMIMLLLVSPALAQSHKYHAAQLLSWTTITRGNVSQTDYHVQIGDVNYTLQASTSDDPLGRPNVDKFLYRVDDNDGQLWVSANGREARHTVKTVWKPHRREFYDLRRAIPSTQ